MRCIFFPAVPSFTAALNASWGNLAWRSIRMCTSFKNDQVGGHWEFNPGFRTPSIGIGFPVVSDDAELSDLLAAYLRAPGNVAIVALPTVTPRHVQVDVCRRHYRSGPPTRQ